VPVGIDFEVPLAHRLERSHLLDAVRVYMLELQPVLEQPPADEPPGGDKEAALVEGHERHHKPLGGAARTRRWGTSTQWRQ
jgi:hypothetical protein